MPGEVGESFPPCFLRNWPSFNCCNLLAWSSPSVGQLLPAVLRFLNYIPPDFQFLVPFLLLWLQTEAAPEQPSILPSVHQADGSQSTETKVIPQQPIAIMSQNYTWKQTASYVKHWLLNKNTQKNSSLLIAKLYIKIINLFKPTLQTRMLRKTQLGSAKWKPKWGLNEVWP